VRADVVLITYRSTVNAQQCLERIVNSCGSIPDLGLIVVDNSPDGIDSEFFESCQAHVRQLQLIRRPDNPGFAAACNLAAQLATAPWLILLNPDLHVEKEQLELVLSALVEQPPDVHSLAIAQRTKGVSHCGIAFNRAGWFHDRPIESSSRSFGPSGGAAAVRTETFLGLGGFREDMFAWGEDADLAIRLWMSGHRTHELSVLFEHDGGHSVVGSSKLGLRKQELLLANRFKIAREHYSLPLRVVFALFACLVFAARLPRRGANGEAMPLLSIFVRGQRELWVGDNSDATPQLRLRDVW
jgi:N-acetylglucosaminyl-diphospho-decaprenol L-rhamnosyltransferase